MAKNLKHLKICRPLRVKIKTESCLHRQVICYQIYCSLSVSRRLCARDTPTSRTDLQLMIYRGTNHCKQEPISQTK